MANSKSLASRWQFIPPLFRFALITALSATYASGQACPPSRADVAALAHEISEAGRQFEKYRPDDPDNSGPSVDANMIYRSAGIGGKALIPALRRISRPGFSPEAVPGAAQVSLAKLGDSEALQQLRLELNGELAKGPWWAPRKLSRVGNDAALALLMNYVEARAGDPSRIVVHSDYGEDPLLEVLAALSHMELLLNPPSRSGNDAARLQSWEKWWGDVRSKSNIYSVSSAEFQDERLQCLARKITWGFPEAILDLADSGDKRVIPLLTDLSFVGDKTEAVSSFDTVRGLAQTGLAMLGDQTQFHLIVHELDTLKFKDATGKLRVIGGERAVAALVSAFDSPNFLADRPDYRADKEHIGGVISSHDEAIASALVQMVAAPPDSTGEAASKDTWKSWWARNKDTTKFTQRRTHE